MGAKVEGGARVVGGAIESRPSSMDKTRTSRFFLLMCDPLPIHNHSRTAVRPVASHLITLKETSASQR